VLDPAAPLRYRGVAAAVDGVGGALAAAMRGGRPVQPVAEMLLKRLPQFWNLARPSGRAEGGLGAAFDRLRQTLDDLRPGFGIERIAYELNPTLGCLSPLIATQCVLDYHDLLPALEWAAGEPRRGRFVVDRHLAGFAAARSGSRQGSQAVEIATALGADPPRGMLLFLCALQGDRPRDRALAVPRLAQWVAGELQPLIDRFHHRARRARLAEQLVDAARKGDLVAMRAVAENEIEKSEDRVGLDRARRRYHAIDREIAAVAAAVRARGARAGELGGWLAATFANTVVAIGLLLMLLGAA
jgi:hypothetical protein